MNQPNTEKFNTENPNTGEDQFYKVDLNMKTCTRAEFDRWNEAGERWWNRLPAYGRDE